LAKSWHITGPEGHVDFPISTKNITFVEDYPVNIYTKFHVRFCHHFLSFCSSINLYILISFFETIKPVGTTLGRNVQWMILYKDFLFQSKIQKETRGPRVLSVFNIYVDCLIVFSRYFGFLPLQVSVWINCILIKLYWIKMILLTWYILFPSIINSLIWFMVDS
jgi:hypothetical protein